MNFKKVFALMFLLSCLSVIQCRKNSPLSCTAFALEIQDEISAWSNAASAYSQDPTPENCREYKSTGQDYLNALKRYGNCTFTFADKASYDESLQDAQKSLDDLSC